MVVLGLFCYSMKQLPLTGDEDFDRAAVDPVFEASEDTAAVDPERDASEDEETGPDDVDMDADFLEEVRGQAHDFGHTYSEEEDAGPGFQSQPHSQRSERSWWSSSDGDDVMIIEKPESNSKKASGRSGVDPSGVINLSQSSSEVLV